MKRHDLSGSSGNVSLGTPGESDNESHPQLAADLARYGSIFGDTGNENTPVLN